MLTTENLLQKLEERMMLLVSELENLRQSNLQLSHEISALKSERENSSKSLNDLISLLDSVGSTEAAMAKAPISALAKPMLVQG
jgi:chromosome segregation ATPase